MTKHKYADFADLREVIKLLEVLEKAGFASETSPVEPILDILIEYTELLAFLFSNHWKAAARPNPGIVFRDDLPADELGNLKSIKLFRRVQLHLPSPELSEIFWDIASEFIKIKYAILTSENLYPFKMGPDVMSALKDVFKNLDRVDSLRGTEMQTQKKSRRKSAVRPIKGETLKSQQVQPVKHESIHYFRRRRSRHRKSPHKGKK